MASTSVLDRPVAETSAGRALPANLEAEAAFLGAVLIDNRVLEELPVPLQPAHFFEPLHARIFERIQVLIDKQMVVTPVTLKPYFETDPAIVELGGTGYLARRGLAQRAIVGIANREVFAHRPTKAAEAEPDRSRVGAVTIKQGDRQPVLGHCQSQ